jgi:hypothetical protein
MPQWKGYRSRCVVHLKLLALYLQEKAEEVPAKPESGRNIQPRLALRPPNSHGG